MGVEWAERRRLKAVWAERPRLRCVSPIIGQACLLDALVVISLHRTGSNQPVRITDGVLSGLPMRRFPDHPTLILLRLQEGLGFPLLPPFRTFNLMLLSELPVQGISKGSVTCTTLMLPNWSTWWLWRVWCRPIDRLSPLLLLRSVPVRCRRCVYALTHSQEGWGRNLSLWIRW